MMMMMMMMKVIMMTMMSVMIDDYNRNAFHMMYACSGMMRNL